MRAIETRYKGYRFRSRLEARWAVFFDALGLKWEYEPEGYALPSGRYLPDFKLNTLCSCGPWFEVKGPRPTEREIKLLCELCECTSSYGILAYGQIGEHKLMAVHKEGHVTGEESDAENWLDLNGNDWRRGIHAARSARFEFGEAGSLIQHIRF